MNLDALLSIPALPEQPHDGYRALRAEAVRQAGPLTDIARRVVLHHQLYIDSGKNHVFPLVALHGALWAAGFFESSGRLGQMLRLRYFYDARERASRMAMLNGFAEGFRAVNRLVFIDTYTNYLYTKHYGEVAAAGGILHPELFDGLVRMHRANRAGSSLSPTEKRELFSRSLRFEQEVTVAPGVQAEIAKFDCPILRFLCMRPVVRFRYFPAGTYFIFRDFASTAERIDKAMRSFGIGERTGWSHVEASRRSYDLISSSDWDNPADFLSRSA